MRQDSESDEYALRRLRRFALLHRVNRYAFFLSILFVFGGLTAALASVEWASYLVLLGFAAMGILILETYVVYPFLICPRCGKRFFLPNGLLQLLARVDALQKKCLHCDLELPR